MQVPQQSDIIADNPPAALGFLRRRDSWPLHICKALGSSYSTLQRLCIPVQPAFNNHCRPSTSSLFVSYPPISCISSSLPFDAFVVVPAIKTYKRLQHVHLTPLAWHGLSILLGRSRESTTAVTLRICNRVPRLTGALMSALITSEVKSSNLQTVAYRIHHCAIVIVAPKRPC